MSKFLDELFENLDENEPENEVNEETTDTVEDTVQDEVEETEDDNEAEEIAEVEEPKGAPEETEAEDDDDTELTPAERKAYGRLRAVQAEREKRQAAVSKAEALQAELDQSNARFADMQRKQAEMAAQNLPNPYEDPTGYIEAKEAEYQTALLTQALNFSIQSAIRNHGEDEVKAAVAWFESYADANPSLPLRQNMHAQADQVEYVVNSYKQTQRMNAVAGGDISALVAELQRAGYNISKSDTTTGTAPAAPVTQSAPAPVVASAPIAPAAPKRSKLANAQGSTTAAPKYTSMMDAVIRR